MFRAVLGHARPAFRSGSQLEVRRTVSTRAAERTPPTPQTHVPVLLSEAVGHLVKGVEGVDTSRQRIFCDATFGAGGYTQRLLDTVDCKVIAVDVDPVAHKRAVELSQEGAYAGRLLPVHGRFGDLVPLVQATLNSQGQCLDGILFDIGVSSGQLDEAHRGFTFRFKGPLDMRMASTGDGGDSGKLLDHSITAEVVVNQFAEADLANIIYEYGEDRMSRRIAQAIVNARAIKPITTTVQLAGIVASVVRGRYGARGEGFKHPAMLTFQALRIYVNDELNQLRRGLKSAELLLRPGAPLVCVSFHSLEDRIIKQFMKKCAIDQSGAHTSPSMADTSPFVSPEMDELDVDLMSRRGLDAISSTREAEKSRIREKRQKYENTDKKVAAWGHGGADVESDSIDELPLAPSFSILTKRAVKPSREEVYNNPRSRSAKLRAAVRTANPPCFPYELG
ncbi:MraW methylase family-domain-containing protein [Fimicolochytrium jonesii]|uniref:MraW methylase family-domain-containing protein n=1 Tax=Fimicolochytrium jonesii TaxID=1396493 RepID=UPI0022FE8C44|nr:MraW methylase family-domain-containing protein [Fimicolochytrium jonesii]KAI8824248.1 MraW methylase family-domain-containing protein [Fimicolochytrium jonesii]